MQPRVVTRAECIPGDWPHRYIVEASTLNLRPGVWPNRLPTDLGNGQPLIRVRLDPSVAIYKQQGSPVVLHVLND